MAQTRGMAELTDSTWGEIDLSTRVWTVPARRMKAGRKHRVPLPDRTIEILGEASKLRESDQDAAYL